MEPKKSLFLDFIRIAAALLVLYGHAVIIFFGNVNRNPFDVSNMKHFAVVLFFVLSGYVIGYTTKSKNRGLIQFAVARLSRLYSMVFPALIISFLIECTIIYYTSSNFNLELLSIVRYIVAALFMNEFWLFNSAPRINGVLWSVSFEFFFYLIFAVCFFTKGKAKKVIYTGLACLFAGPKILLMFPIWISGYLAFIYNDRLKKYKNYFLFFIFLISTYISYIYLRPFPYLLGIKPFYFANQFLTDTISGILFSLTIILLPEKKSLNISDWFIKQFRKIADYTFPIYVFHFPLLKLLKLVMIGKLNINNQFYLSVIISLFVSIILGALFEKLRPYWSKLFENLIKMMVEKSRLIKNSNN